MKKMVLLGLIGILVLWGCTTEKGGQTNQEQIETFEQGWNEIQTLEENIGISFKAISNADPGLNLPLLDNSEKLSKAKEQLAEIRDRALDVKLLDLTLVYTFALNAQELGSQAKPALNSLINLDTVNVLEVCSTQVQNSIGKVKEYLNALIELAEKRNAFVEQNSEQAETAGILKFEGSIEEAQTGVSEMDTVTQELVKACVWE